MFFDRFMVGVPSLISPDFVEADATIVNCLQLPEKGEGLLGTQTRHQPRERGPANRFASNSHHPDDDKTAPADFIAQADGLNIVPCCVCMLTIHLGQSALGSQKQG